MKHITYLAKKKITESFQDDDFEIRLSGEKIRRIIKIDPFLNLHVLYLSENQITKIEGLDLLVNLQELYLSGNKINKIEGLDNLVYLLKLSINNNHITKITGLNNLVKLHRLYLSMNQIIKIEGLDKLVNLQRLYLSMNQIIKIEGLDQSVNLWKINLSENKINKIEGLDKLVNLHVLLLTDNNITKIERLDHLVNLEKLELDFNNITKVEGLTSLVNLVELHLKFNMIIEMNDPTQIIPCINLTYMSYDYKIIVHPVITRFLNRNKLKNNEMHIFNDSQNVHDNSINRNIVESVNRLLKDVPLKEVDKTELLNDHILTEKTKRLLLEYIGYPEQHSLLLLSFAELFGIIWQVIQKHSDSSSIKKVLNQEMNDSICKCFTGRMNRLVNVLNGFDPRVIIKISDSDAIANVIIMLKKKYTNVTELKEAVYKELINREYEETVIKDWIDFIE